LSMDKMLSRTRMVIKIKTEDIINFDFGSIQVNDGHHIQ